MKKLPGILFNIEITTQDNEYVADMRLTHRTGGKILRSIFQAKNLKKLAALQAKIATSMMVELLGK